jgi:protein gp37
VAETTGISWTDHTFNGWWGCTNVSPGCDNCYAETLSHRYGFNVWGPGKERRAFGDKHWHEPLRWEAKSVKDGRRHRVFCMSMADVFDAEWPAGVREDLWALIRATPMLDWQLLTKRTRAKWMLKCLPSDWGQGYPNVWLGSSVEDQATADRRIPELLAVPAIIHWLSVEPQIGPVSIAEYWPAIDWVVCGGESGRGARPMLAEWARELRDHCADRGVPYFFKQWGDASPGRQIGAHHGGDLLDGRPWHEFPRREASDEMELRAVG